MYTAIKSLSNYFLESLIPLDSRVTFLSQADAVFFLHILAYKRKFSIAPLFKRYRQMFIRSSVMKGDP